MVYVVFVVFFCFVVCYCSWLFGCACDCFAVLLIFIAGLVTCLLICGLFGMLVFVCWLLLQFV